MGRKVMQNEETYESIFMDQARSYDLGGSVGNVECSSTKRLHHELYFPKNSKRNRESSTIHALGISTNQDNTRDY